MKRRRGLLMVNGDDARLLRAARAAGVPLRTFGLGRRCDIRAAIVHSGAHGTRFTVQGEPYRLSVPGRHFVYAALPAVAMGLRVGLTPRRIAAALARRRPVALRGGVRRKKKVSFILDCYNANPDSMRSALALLADLAAPSTRVAVLGDMLELGRYAKRLHRRLGAEAARTGLRMLVAAGAHAAVVAAGAREAGMRSGVYTVADAAGAAERLRAGYRVGDTVLLKASRALAFETVFERF